LKHEERVKEDSKRERENKKLWERSEREAFWREKEHHFVRRFPGFARSSK
jgi:hypothetical protein